MIFYFTTKKTWDMKSVVVFVPVVIQVILYVTQKKSKVKKKMTLKLVENGFLDK